MNTISAKQMQQCKTQLWAHTMFFPGWLLYHIGPSCLIVFGFTRRLIMAGYDGFESQNSYKRDPSAK
jgi:hypothetical protein